MLSGLSHQFQSFRAAMQFMTCIPAGSVDDISPAARNDMLIWYPAVGAVIGVILILGEWLSSPLNDFMQASLLLTIWVVVTGGLHLDGLADCADAWVGGLGDREKTLKIMDDPRCGTIAVIAVTLTLIMKFAALVSFQNWIMLLLIPILARLMIIPAFLWLPYAREFGLGGEIQQALTQQKRNHCKVIVAVIGVLPLVLISFRLWILLLVVLVITFLLWRFTMIKRLQGFTGDCIGLLIELSEVVLAVAFVAYVWTT